MERRRFILTSAGALGTLAITNQALADEKKPAPKPPEKLILSNQIGTNHGHALELDLPDLILLMREADEKGKVVVDIQGTSGHPHTLELNVDEIAMILIDGKLVKNSSVDFGHAHAVQVTLTEPTPVKPTPKPAS